jgi:peptide/nickel transport system substrate-binding protein
LVRHLVLSGYRRRFAFVVLVAAAGVCAPCCARPPDPVAPAIMRIGIGAPPQGTPGTGLGSVVRLLTGEPWLTNRPDGRQSERVATGWEWDSSATTLRLKLRKDVYFHDGDRLTPEIASAALRDSVTHPGRDGSSFASVTSITPTGDDTVVLKLAEPNSFLLSDLSGLLVVKRKDKTEVLTGPFRVVSQTPESATLSAFPQYYRGRPGLSGIEVINYATQRKAWTALMRGEIDMLHEVRREAIDFVQAEKAVKSYQPYYIPLVFNVGHPALKLAEVRKALNEAIDKEALVRDGMKNKGRPADSPIWPEHWAHSTAAPRFAFDPDAARRRLDAAGFKVKSKADGTFAPRFSFSCMVLGEDPRFDRLAVLVQKQLADVGVDMKLQPVAQADLAKRAASGDFDAFIFEMAGRSLARVYEFWRSHDGMMVKTGYTAADAAFDKVRASRTDDETRSAVAELERVLYADPPAAFLAWQATSRAVSIKFDVAAEDNRDIQTNVWQWRLAGTPKQVAR